MSKDAAMLYALDAGDLGIPIAQPGFAENTTKQPDLLAAKMARQPWAEVTILPVDSAQHLQTVDKDLDLLQVDLYYPTGNGRAALIEKREEVTLYFRPHRRFAYAGQGVTVVSRESSRIRDLNGWQVVSVTVTFKSVVERPFV